MPVPGQKARLLLLRNEMKASLPCWELVEPKFPGVAQQTLTLLQPFMPVIGTHWTLVMIGISVLRLIGIGSKPPRGLALVLEVTGCGPFVQHLYVPVFWAQLLSPAVLVCSSTVGAAREAAVRERMAKIVVNCILIEWLVDRR
jgi:hypothetical protein